MEVVIDDFRQTVHTNAVITASGSAGPFIDIGAKEVVLIINVSGAVTGTSPTLTYTMTEVDPGDGATAIGASVTGVPIIATGTQILSLPIMRGSSVKISWVIGGTATPTFNGVYATILNKVAGSTALYDNVGNAVFGPSGTPGIAALTVQGITGGTPQPVSISSVGDRIVTGNIINTGDTVTISTQGISVLSLVVSGTWAGNLRTEYTVDGITFTSLGFYTAPFGGSTTTVINIGANGQWVTPTPAFNQIRIRATSMTSGTAVITWEGSQATSFTTGITQVTNTVTTTSLDGSSQGSLGALNATLSQATNGLNTFGFQLIAGTLIGTIVPEISYDGGTTWVGTYFVDPVTGTLSSSLVYASSNTAATKAIIGAPGGGNIRVRVSAYTSGTATGTLRASATNQTNPLYATSAGSPVPPSVVQVGGTDGVDIRPLSTGTTGILNVSETDTQLSSSYPDQGSYTTGTTNPNIDQFGNLETRGPVITDEGSLRDDFSGTGLTTALTGTVTFTNGSTVVTGSGTTFTTQVRTGQYIKKTADSETFYVQVGSVDSDTQITLNSAYTGTTSGAASVVSTWRTTTPTTGGGTITVASSIITLTTGTTSLNTAAIQSLGDYLPYSFQAYASVSQRIANQSLYLGFVDSITSLNQECVVVFSGTNNTQCSFNTSFSSAASDLQSTTVTLPNGGNTSTFHTYKIDLGPSQATLSIDGVVVATNTTHLPSPYTNLYVVATATNTATAATSTNLNIDYIYFENVDRIQLDHDFPGEAMPTTSVDQTGNGSLAATGTVIAITGGKSTVAFDLTGTYSGTVSFQAQAGDGTWVTVQAYSAGTQTFITSLTGGTVGLYTIPCGGYSQVRANMTVYTSGTLNITWNAGTGHTVIPATGTFSGNVGQGTAAALSGAWPMEITDGTTGPVAVKAASTAAVATDKALVVAISPNNSITTSAVPPSDNHGSGTIAVLNGTVVATTGGCAAVAFSITGTWVGVIAFDGQAGDGTWSTINAFSNSTTTFGNYTSSFTANGLYIAPCGGFTQVRSRASGYTSGTIAVTWNAGVGSNVFQTIVTGTTPAGTSSSAAPVVVGGEDYLQTVRTLLTDTGGRVIPAGIQNDGFIPSQVVLGSVTETKTMRYGFQTGSPVIGRSHGVGRIARLNRLGHTLIGHQTMLAEDFIEGSTINSWLWTQSTTTMTISQTSGLLTLNANSTTTTTTDAIITSNRQFPIVNQAPVACSFKALVTQTTNAVNEIGFGAPTGTTAIISNGAFFRVNASGTVNLVLSNAGTETVTSSVATLTTSSYYVFMVEIEDGGARFFMEDSSGVPIVDVFAQNPVGTPDMASAVTHIPAFARVYNSGAAGAAAQTKIASFQAWQYDINTSKPWAEQLASVGKSSNIGPTTFTQTAQLAAGAAPSTLTPASTTSAYTTLGGEYSLNSTASSENLLGVFGYQVPSPYAFMLTDILLPLPAVTTALGATTPNIQEWCLMVASSANPSTATGQRYTLGVFSAAASAAAGTMFSGQPLNPKFGTPIMVLPGQFLLVLVKVFSGVATGVYRGSIFINGYFE